MNLLGRIWRTTVFAIPLMLTICGVLTIHEYGHFSELKKRSIPVAEFSIGIGKLLYQYRSGETTYSFRLFPVMAYVLPSDEGQKLFDRLSFKNRFIVLSAGVRNNLITGMGGVLALQILSVRTGTFSMAYLAREILWYPIRVVALYLAFFISFFSARGIRLFERFRFPVLTYRYHNMHVNRFIWWSIILAFANFIPVGGLDGGKIFLEVFSPHFGPWFAEWAPVALSVFFWFVMFGGVRVDEVVDFGDVVLLEME